MWNKSVKKHSLFCVKCSLFAPSIREQTQNKYRKNPKRTSALMPDECKHYIGI